METKITINYRYWKADGTEGKQEFLELMDDHATNRITELWAEGYTSGELNYTDPAGTEWRGHWEMTTSRL